MDLFVYLAAICKYSTFKCVQYLNDKLFLSQDKTAALFVCAPSICKVGIIIVIIYEY